MTNPALPFSDLSGFLNDQSRRIDRLERTPRVRPNNRSSFGTESPTSIFDAARILSGNLPSSGLTAGVWTLSDTGEPLLIDVSRDLGSGVTATLQDGSSSIGSYVSFDEYGMHFEATALYHINIWTRWDFDTNVDSWSGRAWTQLSGVSGQLATLDATTGGPDDFADSYCTGLLSQVTVGSTGDTPDVSFACYGSALLTNFSGYLSIMVLDSTVS